MARERGLRGSSNRREKHREKGRTGGLEYHLITIGDRDNGGCVFGNSQASPIGVR
jgi:hypothetical protein